MQLQLPPPAAAERARTCCRCCCFQRRNDNSGARYEDFSFSRVSLAGRVVLRSAPSRRQAEPIPNQKRAPYLMRAYGRHSFTFWMSGFSTTA